MSIEAQRFVWNLPLDPSEKLVAIALAHFAHEDGTNARPSQQTLAEMTGLSVRSVRRILVVLSEKNVIFMTNSAGRSVTKTYSFRTIEKRTSATLQNPKSGHLRHKKRTSATQKADTGVLQIERIDISSDDTNENPDFKSILNEIRSGFQRVSEK